MPRQSTLTLLRKVGLICKAFYLNSNIMEFWLCKFDSLQVDEGNADELTEFDIKKKEKEEKVAELREKLAALKEKESETRNKYDSEKAALDEHR